MPTSRVPCALNRMNIQTHQAYIAIPHIVLNDECEEEGQQPRALQGLATWLAPFTGRVAGREES
eukprot:1184476-Prorocentrum_minimum.AAC.5